MASAHGFFGKLPARGDFVRAGLPRDFVSRWDAWLSAALPAALEATGDFWLQAPVWRFRLAPGVCGEEAATGLLFPSVDKVGRRFPLTLVWLGEALDLGLMAAAERLGHVVINEGLPPDELARQLASLPVGASEPMPASGSLWEACDGREPLVLPGLPDVGRFAEMMTGDMHDG